jgi:hypothetical protein
VLLYLVVYIEFSNNPMIAYGSSKIADISICRTLIEGSICLLNTTKLAHVSYSKSGTVEKRLRMPVELTERNQQAIMPSTVKLQGIHVPACK